MNKPPRRCIGAGVFFCYNIFCNVTGCEVHTENFFMPHDIRPPRSLEELRRGRRPIRNPNVVHQQGLSSVEHFSIWIAEHVGSINFFFVILGWTILWLGWNMFGPRELRFDPYPGFVLWLFISNVLQLFLLPLIMFGQAHLDRHSEARAEEDFEISLRSEKEIETILQHLEYQNALLTDIQERLEKKL